MPSSEIESVCVSKPRTSTIMNLDLGLLINLTWLFWRGFSPSYHTSTFHLAYDAAASVAGVLGLTRYLDRTHVSLQSTHNSSERISAAARVVYPLEPAWSKRARSLTLLRRLQPSYNKRYGGPLWSPWGCRYLDKGLEYSLNTGVLLLMWTRLISTLARLVLFWECLRLGLRCHWIVTIDIKLRKLCIIA